MIRIDRLEEGIVVCEDQNGNLIYLQRDELPETVREGDCLVPGETGWIVDEALTRARRQSAAQRFRRLFKRKNQQ